MDGLLSFRTCRTLVIANGWPFTKSTTRRSTFKNWLFKNQLNSWNQLFWLAILMCRVECGSVWQVLSSNKFHTHTHTHKQTLYTQTHNVTLSPSVHTHMYMCMCMYEYSHTYTRTNTVHTNTHIVVTWLSAWNQRWWTILGLQRWCMWNWGPKSYEICTLYRKSEELILMHTHRTHLNHVTSQPNFELWLLVSNQRWWQSLGLQRWCMLNRGPKSYKMYNPGWTCEKLIHTYNRLLSSFQYYRTMYLITSELFHHSFSA